MSGKLKISFVGIIPALQSAIQISGNGDGAKIRLEAPESELPEVIKLILLRGKALKISVEESDEEILNHKSKNQSSDDDYEPPVVGLSKGDELK